MRVDGRTMRGDGRRAPLGRGEQAARLRRALDRGTAFTTRPRRTGRSAGPRVVGGRGDATSVVGAVRSVEDEAAVELGAAARRGGASVVVLRPGRCAEAAAARLVLEALPLNVVIRRRRMFAATPRTEVREER